METRSFRKGEIIFRQGDAADCMNDVYEGRVGVYVDYGTKNQKLLMEYFPDHYFGEMGLIDQAPRSATAVALTDVCLGVVTEEAFGEFFRKNPARVLMVMQQLSSNLRRRTNEYMEVCRSIHEMAAEEGMV